MRKCMRGDFLFGATSYLLNEAGREMQRIIVLASTHCFPIWVKRLIVITGSECGFELQQLLSGFSKKKTNDRPGSRNTITFEQLQEARNSFACAEQVSPIRSVGTLMVTNAPVELKIQGNYQRAIAWSLEGRIG